MKYQITYSFDTEEELRAHLGGGTTRAAAPAPADEPADVTVDRSALDGDQMPYDADVHSDPPSFTADGLWRAKRGKKEAADAARAAFKARGAAVVAPVIAAAPAAPVMPALGIPAAAPVRQAPVTYEALIEKFTEVNNRGALDAAKIGEVYARLGITDVAVFETNESMRAAMLAELSKF